MTPRRVELGAFLRSRRDRLTPEQAGLRSFPGARRVPGLRRDELAVAAGISPDYYSRLEQGRQANISSSVLDALARVLRLDDVERAHLRDLAAPGHDQRSRATGAVTRPNPGLLRVMVALDHLPVILLGPHAEVLARNTLLCSVLGRPLEPGSSFIRYLFQDGLARRRILNWSHFARAAVGALRYELGRRPDDLILVELIDELRRTDTDVATWWDDHTVLDEPSMTKRINHPDAGRLDFQIETVAEPGDRDQCLVIYTVESESPTARLLPILASWNLDTAGRPPAQGHHEHQGTGQAQTVTDIQSPRPFADHALPASAATLSADTGATPTGGGRRTSAN